MLDLQTQLGCVLSAVDILHETIAEQRAELKQLRNQAAELHTLVECAAPDCKRGVRVRDVVAGMHPECAEAELTRLRGIEAAARSVSASKLRLWADQTMYDQRFNFLLDIADALEAKP